LSNEDAAVRSLYPPILEDRTAAKRKPIKEKKQKKLKRKNSFFL